MKKIILSGTIGWEVNIKDIRDILDSAKGADLEVHLASPGGSVFDGIEIFNLFRDYKRNHPTAQMLLTIKGEAASMAAYLAVNPAWDLIAAEDNAVFMIHNAWGGVVGDYREVSKMAEILDGLTQIIGKAFAQKTGKSVKEIRSLMDDESWYFGDEMQSSGFVDEIIKTEEPKDRESAIVECKIKYESAMQKLKAEDIKTDIDKIAALIKPEIIDKVTTYKSGAKLVDEPWSKSESEARWRKHAGVTSGEDLPKAKYTQRFAYIDTENDDVFDGYSFPHWDYKNGEFVNISACRNGLARLSNSNIPEAEKPRVEALLKKYIARYNEENDLNPALIAGENNMEVMSMTLTEFLEQNPTARIEHEKMLNEKFEAGKKSVQDRIAGAMNYLEPDSAYPGPIRSLAVKTVKGEVSIDSLSAAVATYDSLKEKEKSDDSKDESEKNDGIHGQDDEPLSQDGVIRNENDFQARVNKAKAEKGLTTEVK